MGSIPVLPSIMVAHDWRDAPEGVMDLIGGSINLPDQSPRLRYRYVCRNDGIMLFQIENLRAGMRTAVEIAEVFSNIIKVECKHTHRFNTRPRFEDTAQITTLPVLCDDIGDPQYEDFLSFCEDNQKLQSIRAYSVSLMRVSREPGLLVIKKLYSAMFDRVSRRLAGDDDIATSFEYEAINRRTIHYWTLGVVGITAMLLSLVWLNASYQVFEPASVVLTAVFLAFSILIFIFLRYTVLEAQFRKVRLNQTLTAYMTHGNNYVRALKSFNFSEAQNNDCDFTPIIEFTAAANDSYLRKINSYVTMYGIGVSILGVAIAILALNI